MNIERGLDETRDAFKQYTDNPDEPYDYWITIKDTFNVNEETYLVILDRLRAESIQGVKMNGVFKVNMKGYEHIKLVNLRCTTAQLSMKHKYSDNIVKDNKTEKEIRLIKPGVLKDILDTVWQAAEIPVLPVGPDLFDDNSEEYIS
jgi:hypothetical protein